MKKEIKNMNYKYNVSTFEVLLWESELTPKPEEHLITITPIKDDLAFVLDENKVYEFDGTRWEVIKGEARIKE